MNNHLRRNIDTVYDSVEIPNSYYCPAFIPPIKIMYTPRKIGGKFAKELGVIACMEYVNITVIKENVGVSKYQTN